MKKLSFMAALLCAALSAPAAETVDSASLQIVSETPAGTQKMYNGKMSGYMSMGTLVVPSDKRNVAQRVVRDAEGNVWFYNPVPQMTCNAWIKGTMEGDSTILFTFPQMVNSKKVFPSMQMKNFYAFCYQKVSDNVSMAMYQPKEQQEMRFVIHADGSITAQNPDELLGLSNAVGNPLWCGYGMRNALYTNLPEANVLPEGAATQSYAMTHGDMWAPENGSFVKVATVGQTFYIGGWDQFPNFWVTAKRNGGNVTMPGTQFLGVDSLTNTCVMMYAAEFFPDTLESGAVTQGIRVLPSIEFTYNLLQKKLTPKVANTGFVIEQRGLTTFGDPVIFPQSRTLTLTPMDPVIAVSAEYNPAAGYGLCDTRIPLRSADGKVLEKSCLYFRAYIDGSPLTFEPAVYTSLSEPMTEIPFGFNNSGMEIMSSQTTTIWRFYQQPQQKIGVQSVYRINGEERVSNIVWYQTGAAPSVEAGHGEAVQTEWFSVGGVRIAGPAEGLCIRRTTYADGSVKVEKVIMK